MTKSINFLFGIYVFFSCVSKSEDEISIAVKPLLKVSENGRYLESADGRPFILLSGTTWGMSEWLTREEVDYYLDNRKNKGFNVIQLCLF